ncbi:MAG: guanylate kinase, partial [SAR86 cluster bacterium]|nr:guanylate kinase [SAR86 cluster bacterium]
QDDPHIIQTRMSEAINEISHYQEFEYLIINDDFTVALQDLSRIVNARAADLLVSEQQKRFSDLIAALLA